MRSRQKKEKEKKADLLNAILLGVLGAILLGGILGGGLWLRATAQKLDERTQCPSQGPRAVHAIVIDQTDAISRQQAEQVRLYVERLMDKAAVGERFDLFTIKADMKNVLIADLQVCFPGTGEDANELYQNPKRERQRFEQKFLRPLRDKLNELLAEQSRSSSPILESLKAVAISSYGRYERGEMPFRMTIISDMIQHSGEYSHFRSTANFQELATQSIWPVLRGNLKGADVEILYIVRPEAKRANRIIQDRGHQLFWERVIADSEGRLNGITPF